MLDGGGRGVSGPVRKVPVDGFVEPGFQRGLGGKPELPSSAGHAQTTSWLSVGFSDVPTELPLEATKIGDLLREVVKGDLAAASQVHGRGLVIGDGGLHIPR